MYFPLIAPDSKKVFPIAPDGNDGRWRVGKKRMDELIENELIYWDLKNGKWIPYEKLYFNNQTKFLKQRSILYDIANTGMGTNILTELFGEKIFLRIPNLLNLLNYHHLI